MNWISVKDKSNKIEENRPYLVYGYMYGHWPQKKVAVYRKGTWYAYDDPEYYFREDEIDYYMDIMAFPNPIEGK